MSMVLANRQAITAVDAAGVVGQPHAGSLPAGNVGAMFAVISNVNPATLSVRCGIEFSYDGSIWQQLVRFVDISTVSGQSRVARLPMNLAAAEGVVNGVDMTAAAAAVVFNDGGVGDAIWRCQTRVSTLTGASASVNVLCAIGIVDQGEVD